MTNTKLITLPVEELETCDRVRVRKLKPKINSDLVGEYAEAYECGLITEPLDVFCEPGCERYIVADGENRLLGLRRAKIEQVECRLHEGDEIAALDFAIGCNQAHGLRRTKADCYHAFERIMDMPALKDKYRTDTELSDKIGVSIRTIAAYKARWRSSGGGDRKAKREAQASAEKHTATEPATCRLDPDSEAESGDYGSEISEAPKRKPREKKPELTPEQKRIAKEVAESAKRERLDAANRKTFEEGLQAICSMPFGWDVIAKRWTDIEEDRIRFLRDACDEFLKAREQAKAA